MNKKIEVALDENELAILYRLINDDCQQQESQSLLGIRDKLSSAICTMLAMSGKPKHKRPCPRCGKAGEMFTADLDWCPACGNQWQGT